MMKLRGWPWSERRWAFVMQRMQNLCDAVFVGDVNELRGLVGMRAYARKTPGSPITLSAMEFVLQPEWVSEPPALPEPPELCGSFSKFYRHVIVGYSPLTKRTL